MVPDLIRHGKNHHPPRQQDDAQYHYAATSSASTITPQHNHAHHHKQSRDNRDHRDRKSGTPRYKEEVEKIVKEEREAQSKMPSYKGLEQYKLLDKMGE